MAMLVLDTDVLIDVQRGHPSATTWISTLVEPPSVPGLVVMELIQGAQNTRQVRAATILTARYPIIWPTTDDQGRALVDYARFHLSHRLGLVDALIASCAVGLAADFCTFNQKHYRVVPGLVTIRPYSR